MVIPLTPTERILHLLHLLPVPVMDSFAGVLFGRALAIAVRRGMFDAVAVKALSAPELCAETGLNEEGVTLLAESFVVGGYLLRKENRYIASAEARKWLVKGSPFYLGNFVRYVETLHERWQSLEYSLEHGKPGQPYYAEFTSADWEVYVHGMQDLARLIAAEVVPRITLAHGSRRLLDLGGSHGLYSIRCCQRYDRLEAIIVDFPEALQHTARIVRQHEMEGRISLLGGDFRTMILPGNLDAVLMFNIIHGLTEEENRVLISRVLNDLRPGGKLYILDQMRESRNRSRLKQLIPLMVGLNLLNEVGGTSYGFEDVARWCAQARSVRRLRLRLPGVTLVEVVM